MTHEGTNTTPESFKFDLAFARAFVINSMARSIYEQNHTWWHDLKTGEPIQRNQGEQLMLIVTEIAEAMEGVRKGLPDEHLPHRSMIEVELADALIRILDFAGGYDLDLGGAVIEKLSYNMTRADHQPAARQAPGGKKV